MSRVRPREWLGAIGIASSFFLPIAAGREVDDRLFMWTVRNSAELLVAGALLTLAAFVVLRATLPRTKGTRGEAVVLLVLGLLPALSLTAVTGRSIRAALGSGSLPPWAPVAGAVVLGSAVAAVVALWPDVAARGLRRLFACAALLLLPVVHFGHTAPTSLARMAPHAPTPVPASARCGDVYVLLFDELSYSAVVIDDHIALPQIAALAATATVYHAAISPAPLSPRSTPNTLDAVPVYLNGTAAMSPTSLQTGPIGRAHEAGFHTDVIGWYFPYCDVLGPLAERCRGYSLYNAATASAGFDVVAPFETAINVWPFQMPTGVLKRPLATHVHHANLQAILRDVTAPPLARPAFRWAHFNIPHSPWLHDAGWLSMGAFTPTPARYAAQVEETDRVLGAVVDSVRARGEAETATFVVTADHASRDGFADDMRHVPLIVRTPGGAHRDDRTPVVVEDVLTRVARDACPR